MRVLVCGSRFWYKERYLRRKLDELDAEFHFDVVIEGEAKGADSLARQWALDKGIAVERYPANWDEYGKAAGPIRNTQMLVSGKPDLVVAFSHDITSSRGTANMVQQAKAAGVRVLLFDGRTA